MNKYKQHLLDEEIARELQILGISIKAPRQKLYKKGNFITIDSCSFELLNLLESSNCELWEAHDITNNEKTVLFL